MATKVDIDVPALFRLWNDHTLTKSDVARDLSVSDKHLMRVARAQALPERPHCWRRSSETSEEIEDDGGGETLELSPWVQGRIKELKLGAWAD